MPCHEIWYLFPNFELFTSMRIQNWIFTKMWYESAILPGSILSLRATIVNFLGLQWLHFEPLQILNFDFNFYRDSAFYSKADTDRIIELPKVMQIRISNPVSDFINNFFACLFRCRCVRCAAPPCQHPGAPRPTWQWEHTFYWLSV